MKGFKFPMILGVSASMVFLCALAAWGVPELWTDEGVFRSGLLKKLMIYAAPILVALLYFAIAALLFRTGFFERTMAVAGFLVALSLLFFAAISVFGVMVSIGITGIIFGTFPLAITALSLVGTSLVLLDRGNEEKASIS